MQLEQETTVTWLRGDAARIYTANPVHLRKLRLNPRAKETRGGSDWGEFEVPWDQFDPLKGFKRKTREMTPEQREAAAERLRKAREEKK